MMKKLLYILVFVCSSTVFSQETSYRELVLNYLEVNGTNEQYQGAINQLFELLKKQFQGQNVGEQLWQDLEKEAQPSLQQIKAMLISAYRDTYEKEDIQNMLSFYETGAGQQLLKDQTAMTDNQKEAAAKFYNSPTGLKIIASRDEVSKRVGEVSEIWSRDLYRSMIDKLREKGFNLN